MVQYYAANFVLGGSRCYGLIYIRYNSNGWQNIDVIITSFRWITRIFQEIQTSETLRIFAFRSIFTLSGLLTITAKK